MKKYISIISCCAVLMSCTITKTYNITVSDENDIEKVRELISHNPKGATFKVSTLGNDQKDTDVIKYDEAPKVNRPRLITPANNYNPTDMSTFATYNDTMAVAPPLITDMLSETAIWCTKEHTYVGHIYQMGWDRTFYQMKSGSYIRDCKTGTKYYVSSGSGLPLDETYFIQGIAGEYLCFVDIYPPLPKTCTVIDIIEADATDEVENSPGWGGGIKLSNVRVADLQKNQKILNYKKTKVIE